jgi:hypothetical protein
MSTIGAMAGFGAFALAFALAGTFSAGATLGASTAKREREARVRRRDSVFMGVRGLNKERRAESRTEWRTAWRAEWKCPDAGIG